jgi:hypothetical protein
MDDEEFERRFYLTQVRLRLLENRTRELEAEKENKECERCWSLSLVIAGVGLWLLLVLDIAFANASPIRYKSPPVGAVIIGCLLAFWLLIAGCVKLGVRF